MNEFKRNTIMEEDVETIELLPMFNALMRRWWVILLAGLIFAMGAYVGTKMFVTPMYRSGFTAYVNNRANTEQQTALSNADLSASRYLTYTYAEIINSRTVLENAASKAGCSYSYGQLSDMVGTSIKSDTEIISVYVTSEDPAVSLSLAEAVATVAVEQISSIVDGSSMRIIDAPVMPEKRYSPSYAKSALIGAILGILLAAGVIVLMEVLDDRVKGEESLESRFGLPVLGSVPNVTSASKAGGNYYYAYGSSQSAKGGDN